MTWEGPSFAEMILDYIDEHGPQTVPALQAAFPEHSAQRVKSAVDRLVRLGRVHNTGYTSHRVGTYALGAKPGWLPNPLPAASVWHYAASCEAKAKPAGYEIPVFCA